MKQTEKDLQILQQLHEVAHDYFARIVEANTTDGECKLTPGIYTASQLANRAKNPMRNYYRTPEMDDSEIDVTISFDSFSMGFNRRDIFVVLAKWEKILKVGKLAAKFNVGQAEEKRVIAIVKDGEDVAEKRITLLRYADCWWYDKKSLIIYLEYNGKYITSGTEIEPCQIEPGEWRKEREKFLKDFTPKAIPMFIRLATNCPAWVKVCELAGIASAEEDEKRNNEIVNFVNNLAVHAQTAADVVKVAIRREIDKTVERLKILAASVGLELSDILEPKGSVQIEVPVESETADTVENNVEICTETATPVKFEQLPTPKKRSVESLENSLFCVPLRLLNPMLRASVPRRNKGRLSNFHNLSNPPPLTTDFTALS